MAAFRFESSFTGHLSQGVSRSRPYSSSLLAICSAHAPGKPPPAAHTKTGSGSTRPGVDPERDATKTLGILRAEGSGGMRVTALIP